jgi:hypothetical protein
MRLRTASPAHQPGAGRATRQLDRAASAPAVTPAPRGPAGTLLGLQQSHGNRFVESLVRRAMAHPGQWPGLPARAEPGGGSHVAIQPKLTVSRPGDPDEREADRVADEVMRMTWPGAVASVQPGVPGAVLAGQPGPPGTVRDVQAGRPATVQRACLACEEERQRDEPAGTGGQLFRTAASGQTRPRTATGGPPAPAGAAAAPAAAPPLTVPATFTRGLGPGQLLEPGARAFLEPRFGRDLGAIRVHAGARAARSARAVHARAYTVGRDVVFGAGEYAPGTVAGLRLLAHELTHALQQERRPAVTLHRRTDPYFESYSGVDKGLSRGTLVEAPTIMGKEFLAAGCAPAPGHVPRLAGGGCYVAFAFPKAYTGTYLYAQGAAAGTEQRGVYVKITMAHEPDQCGSCAKLLGIQTVRNVTRSQGTARVVDPGDETRRARSGMTGPRAPSRGWRVDVPVSVTTPFYTSVDNVSLEGNDTRPAVIWDAPTDDLGARDRGKDFQTCAVCERGDGTRRVMACVEWGYYIDGDGKVSFLPAVPAAACGPTPEVRDAARRWEGLPGLQPTGITFP